MDTEETIDEQVTIEKPKRGFFKPGNQYGKRGKGVSKKLKAKERLIAEQTAEGVRQEAARQAKETISGAMPKLVTDLKNRALEGDNVAAAMLLKHGLPLSSQETRIEGMEDIAALAPETRIKAINARMLAGQMPVEHARFAIDSAKDELNAEIVQPLRRVMLDLKAGIDPIIVIQRLAGLAGDLEMLEHDG